MHQGMLFLLIFLLENHSERIVHGRAVRKAFVKPHSAGSVRNDVSLQFRNSLSQTCVAYVTRYDLRRFDRRLFELHNVYFCQGGVEPTDSFLSSLCDGMPAPNGDSWAFSMLCYVFM